LLTKLVSVAIIYVVETLFSVSDFDVKPLRDWRK